MTEQPKYKLYAIYTKHLAKDELKGFEYSLVANNRYALVISMEELNEPFRELPDDIELNEDEKRWKAECECKITEAKIKQNVSYMQEHEDEYSEFLNQFCDRLTEELEKEAQANKKDNP